MALEIMQVMLFVSFWNLSLSNLPVGSFTNASISAHEAARRIASARSEARLLCVSEDDLAAPYKRRAYEKHVELCSVLANLGVALSVEDFFGSNYCTPLQMATVGPGKSLLVVNCGYTYDFMLESAASKGPRFRFEVLSNSITFNLLQMPGDTVDVTGSEIEAAMGSAALGSKSCCATFASGAQSRASLEAGASFRIERLSSGDMISIDEAAALTGTSLATIEEWIAQGRAIGLLEAGHDMRLPRWQFEQPLWSVLGQISDALGVDEGWAILSFLESSNGGLNGTTPRAAIEQGDALRVIDLAGACS